EPLVSNLAPPPQRRSRRGALAAMGIAGGLAAVAVVLAALGGDAESRFHATSFERAATDARAQAIGFESAALVAAGAALTVGGVGIWLLLRTDRQPLQLSVTPAGARVVW